jgi:hypothetical protein
LHGDLRKLDYSSKIFFLKIEIKLIDSNYEELDLSNVESINIMLKLEYIDPHKQVINIILLGYFEDIRPDMGYF